MGLGDVDEDWWICGRRWWCSNFWLMKEKTTSLPSSSILDVIIVGIDATKWVVILYWGETFQEREMKEWMRGNWEDGLKMVVVTICFNWCVETLLSASMLMREMTYEVKWGRGWGDVGLKMVQYVRECEGVEMDWVTKNVLDGWMDGLIDKNVFDLFDHCGWGWWDVLQLDLVVNIIIVPALAVIVIIDVVITKFFKWDITNPTNFNLDRSLSLFILFSFAVALNW